VNATAPELSGQLRDMLAQPEVETLPASVPMEVGPGLYPGVNALEYHRWSGASQSRLKLMRDKSPAHMRHHMLHPTAPTEALIQGAAVHTCVLEPDLFPLLYTVAERCEATTGKGERCKLPGVLRRDGQWYCHTRGHDPQPGTATDPVHALSRDDWQMCLAIRERVAAHPNTQHMLEGESEQSAVWMDPDTHVLCRGRFDVIARGIGAVVDLKTTQSAHPLRFRRTIFDFGYHIQAAMYVRGAKALGLDIDSFGIVAVEKEPPYEVAVYQLEAAALFDGERELMPLLEQWATCEATGIWPGYSTDIVKIDLPAYAPHQITERWSQ
jgi:exodeoxyribonuclease VIII